MEKVIKVIENICSLTKAQVDRNYGQGWEAVASQLAIRMAEDEEPLLVDKLMADKYITSFMQDCQKLKEFVSPHQLPDDYLFFLEYYGGISLGNSYWGVTLNGIGPMVEEWYESILGYNSQNADPKTDGLLSIGNTTLALMFMSKTRYSSITYFLDLAGVIQRNAIIGIKSGSGIKFSSYSEVINNLDKYKTVSKIVAPSFTEWLELIIQNEDAFGFLPDFEKSLQNLDKATILLMDKQEEENDVPF